MLDLLSLTAFFNSDVQVSETFIWISMTLHILKALIREEVDGMELLT